MSIQDLRLQVCAELEHLLPEGWQMSTETGVKLHSGLVHVGHVAEVQFQSFGSVTFDLFVTVWVNEAEDVDAAAKLYALISPGAGSIFWEWWRQTVTGPTGPPVVERVGDMAEGPTRFLAAVIRLPMQMSTP